MMIAIIRMLIRIMEKTNHFSIKMIAFSRMMIDNIKKTIGFLIKMIDDIKKTIAFL